MKKYGATFIALVALLLLAACSDSDDGQAADSADGVSEIAEEAIPALEPVSSQAAPLAQGQTGVAAFGEFRVEVEVLQVLVGDEALDAVRDAGNRVYRPDIGSADERFITLQVRASVVEGPSGVMSLGADDWTFLSSDGTTYASRTWTQFAGDEFSGALSDGGRLEGWINLVIGTDDGSPLAAFGGPEDGVWFELQAPASAVDSLLACRIINRIHGRAIASAEGEPAGLDTVAERLSDFIDSAAVGMERRLALIADSLLKAAEALRDNPDDPVVFNTWKNALNNQENFCDPIT